MSANNLSALPVLPRDDTEFDQILEANKDFLLVVSFIAPWSENCNSTKELTRELLTDPELKQVLFIELPAEEFPKISLRYDIKSVPSVLFIRKKEVIERLVGADVRNYAGRVVQFASDGSIVEGIPVRTVERNNANAEAKNSVSLEDRLKALVNEDDVMIFMKGDPAQPRCGFSRQVVQLINDTGVKYKTFDILEDEDVRQGLKDYSNWQTYPQIYVKGQLVGGLDVLREMQEMGSLEGVLKGTEPF